MINKQGDWRTRFEYRAMLVTFVLALFLPLVISKPLATEIVIYALFALGFNLLLGHTGIISFGHAAYLGVGAYSAAMAVIYGGAGVWGALLAATLGGTLVAVMIGIMAINRKGAYFAMISLAIGQMFYFLTLSPLKRWTQGEDGAQATVAIHRFPFACEPVQSASSVLLRIDRGVPGHTGTMAYSEFTIRPCLERDS